MVRYGLHVLIALLGLLLQSTLFSALSADVLKPDIAFLVVVYLGLHRPAGEATPSVVVIGYLADRFSALPDGTFLLIYLCAFYLAAASSNVFYFRGTGFPALMVLVLSMAQGQALDVMVRYGRTIVGEEPAGLGHGFWFLVLFAAVNVVFSLPVYRLCRRVDHEGGLGSTQRATL